MINLEMATAFFGWCSVINFAVLLITTVMLSTARGFIAGVHSRLMGVDREDLSAFYFSYLANYKIAIFMLNIVPYIALKLIH